MINILFLYSPSGFSFTAKYIDAQYPAIMARILSVSYDKSLLRTRQTMLENKGHVVVSSATIYESIAHCKQGKFDLFILGHSIPSTDKQQLVNTFRYSCPAPIIALRTHAGEELIIGADYHIEPDPEPLLNLVGEILRWRLKARVLNLFKRNRAVA
jgi:CheY-like chemotaxis protein